MWSFGGIHLDGKGGKGPRTQDREGEQGKLELGCPLLLLAAPAFRSVRLAAGMVKMVLADTAVAVAAKAMVGLVSIVAWAVRIGKVAALIVFEVVVFEF